MPIYDDLEFGKFVRDLPAASEADLAAGNNMPLVRSDDVKKLPAEGVASVHNLGYEFFDEGSRIKIYDGWVRYSDGALQSNAYNKSYFFEVVEGSKIDFIATSIDTNPVAVAFYSNAIGSGYIKDSSICAEVGNDVEYSVVAPVGARFMAITTRTSAVSNFRARIFKPISSRADEFAEIVSVFSDDESLAGSVVAGYINNSGVKANPAHDGEKVYVFDNKGYSRIECCVSASFHSNNYIIGFYCRSADDEPDIWYRSFIGGVLCERNTTDGVFYVQVPPNTEKIVVCNDESIATEGKFFIRLWKNVVSTNDFRYFGFAKKSLGYQELKLPWVVIGNRAFSGEFSVYPGASVRFKFKSSYGLNFAIHGINNSNVDSYDSGWKTDFTYTVPDNIQKIYFWLRKADNANLSNDDIDGISSALETFSAETIANDGYTASIKYVDGRFDNLADKIKNIAASKIIRNVAHQGFSTNGQYYGNSRLSSYVGAAKNGFDFGECDVQFSSDGVPVCCHDATFVDGFSGSTITIADHTAEELKTYQYYGETIATLEEVIAKCKEVGIGLYIDKTGNFMGDTSKRELVFSLVKKYAMEDNVVWLIGVNQSFVDAITSWYDRAAISVIPTSYSGGISEGFVTFMNSLENGKRRVSADLNASMVSVEQIKSANAQLKCGVTIEVWTIDDKETYQQYKPYVSAITSNKLSEQIING